jgi:predicted aconitase
MLIAGTYSCTPYLMGYLPPKGSHIASIETSAVIYFNSVLGARSNRDGPFAIYAALTGKYPACGYHLDQDRKGSHLVRVEAGLNSPTDYGALGLCIGDRVGGGVPVITGLRSPRQEDLIAMGATMSTSTERFTIPESLRMPDDGASPTEMPAEQFDWRQRYSQGV